MSMQVCGSETEYYIYNENIALLISENEIKETYDFTKIFAGDISKGYIIQPYTKAKKAVLYNNSSTFVSDYNGNKSKIYVDNVSKAQWVDENNILLAGADNNDLESSNRYIAKYDILSGKTTDKLSLSASVNLELYKTSDQYGYLQYADDSLSFDCIGFVDYASGGYNKYKWSFLNESAQKGYNSKYLVMANSVDGVYADIYLYDCENQILYKSEDPIKSVDNLFREFTDVGEQMLPSTYHVGNVQISSNGKIIAFENAKNRNIELYVVV